MNNWKVKYRERSVGKTMKCEMLEKSEEKYAKVCKAHHNEITCSNGRCKLDEFVKRNLVCERTCVVCAIFVHAQ